MAVAVIFGEVGASLSKKEYENHELGIYSLLLLSYFWSLFVFVIYGLLSKEGIVFSIDSVPTFSIRVILEFAIVYFAMKAIVEAPRSSFAFVRLITIPGIIAMDLLLGYGINRFEMFGMALIFLSIIFLNKQHNISKKGLMATIVVSIIAIFTITLYKYNIENFNTVSAEQIAMYIILITVLSILTFRREHKTILGLCKNKKYLMQSVVAALNTGLASVAYMFGSASVISTFKRAFAILISIISGKMYFHEKHIISKLIGFVIVLAGVILVAVGQF